jgi:hypothetical protein
MLGEGVGDAADDVAESIVTIDMHYRVPAMVVGHAPIHVIAINKQAIIAVVAWDAVVRQTYTICAELSASDIIQHGKLRKVLNAIVATMLDGQPLL